MDGRIRGAALIGLWFGIGVTVTVFAAAAAGDFPSRSGWLIALGIVVAVGSCFVLVLQTADELKTSAARRSTRASALIAGASALTSVVLAALGVFGGPGRALPTIAEAPGRLIGQVHGMWDSALLEQDLDVLHAQLGDRALQNLYLMDTFYTVDAYALESPVGVDEYVLRTGDLTLSDRSEGWSTSAEFTVADVDASVIRSVSERIYQGDPDARIAMMYLSAGSGFTIHVSIEGEYTSTSRVFDGRTGRELTER